MKKLSIILIFLVSFFSAFSQGTPSLQQRTNGQTTVADPNLFSLRSFKVPVYTDTTSANISWPTLDSAGKIIYTLDTKNFWVRQIPPRRWKKVLNAGDVIDSISVTDSSICQWKDGVADCKIFNTIINIPSLSDALISVQGISLVDTTVTILPNIVSRRDNIQFTQTTPSVFQVNKADTGYSRFDLIYIDSLNVIRLIEGVQDTGVVTPPVMPPHGIQVTIISIVGDVVQQPVPSVSTNYWSPNLNNIVTGNANFGLSNNRSLGIYTSGLVRAVFDTIGQLRFPLINNGNYPHALTFYNNADATVPSFNLAVNAQYGEISLRANNSGYLNAFRFKKGNNTDSIVGGAYSDMLLQDYGKLKYNTTNSQTSVFEVTQANTPLFTVNSTTKPGAYFGNDTTYKPSSALTISSTTQGILVPRMTTTQMNAIGTPSNGLLIYNLDSTAFYYYQLSAWTKIATGSGSSTQDTLFVKTPLSVTNDTLSMKQASAFDSGWISPQQAVLIGLVPTAVESIVAITDSSFENTHIDGNKDTTVLRGSGGGGGWLTTGNTVSPNTQFLGSTNDSDVVFKRNSIEAGRIGSTQTSFGNTSTANGNGSTSLGFGAISDGTLASSFGKGASAGGNFSVSVGQVSTAGGTNSLAFGSGSLSSGDGSVSIGANSTSNNTSSIAIGSSATAQGNYSIAIGSSVNAPVDNSIILYSEDTIKTKVGINTQYPLATTHIVGNGTDPALLAMNGNVGIGTTTPDSSLTNELGLFSKRGVRFSGLSLTGFDTTTNKPVVINSSGTLSKMNWPAAGTSGITALTGDVTASGSGSVTATLATVNSNVGSFGSATQVGTFTVNGKGLITAASNTSIAIDTGAVSNFGVKVRSMFTAGSNINITAGLIVADTSIGVTKLATQGFVSRSYLPIASPNATGKLTADTLSTQRLNLSGSNFTSKINLASTGSYTIANGLVWGANDVALYQTSQFGLGTNGSFTVTGATIANSSLTVSSGNTTITSLRTAYSAKTANYTIAANDYTINCTSGSFTVTLPTAVGVAGQVYEIVNSGAGTITVGTTSSQVFSNVTATPTTLTMATVGTRVVKSNGANWLLISSL